MMNQIRKTKKGQNIFFASVKSSMKTSSGICSAGVATHRNQNQMISMICAKDAPSLEPVGVIVGGCVYESEAGFIPISAAHTHAMQYTRQPITPGVSGASGATAASGLPGACASATAPGKATPMCGATTRGSAAARRSAPSSRGDAAG